MVTFISEKTLTEGRYTLSKKIFFLNPSKRFLSWIHVKNLHYETFLNSVQNLKRFRRKITKSWGFCSESRPKTSGVTRSGHGRTPVGFVQTPTNVWLLLSRILENLRSCFRMISSFTWSESVIDQVILLKQSKNHLKPLITFESCGDRSLFSMIISSRCFFSHTTFGGEGGWRFETNCVGRKVTRRNDRVSYIVYEIMILCSRSYGSFSTWRALGLQSTATISLRVFALFLVLETQEAEITWFRHTWTGRNTKIWTFRRNFWRKKHEIRFEGRCYRLYHILWIRH